MKAAASEDARRFHQKHRLVLVVEEVRAELIGETPASGGGLVQGRHDHDILLSVEEP
jgi:hypothetical protein